MSENEIVASVNICSPLPYNYPLAFGNKVEGGIYDNARQVAYIQPLLEKGLIYASKAYYHNLDNHQSNLPPVVRPGLKYRFWFKNKEDAIKFANEFSGELEIPPIGT